jgi:hypothetical protein
MMTFPRQVGRLILAAAVAALLTGEARAQFNQFNPAPQVSQFNPVNSHRNPTPNTFNPWGNSVFGLPMYSTPYNLGRLPNGTPVIDPWSRPSVHPPVVSPAAAFVYQLALLNASTLWNPILPYWGTSAGLNSGWNFGFNGFNGFGGFGGFGAQYSWNFGAFGNYGFSAPGFGFGAQGFAATNLGIQPGLGFGFGPITQREPGRFARLAPDLAVNPITGTVLQPYSGVAYTNEGTFYRLAGSGTLTPFGAYVPGSGLYVNPFTGVAYNPQTGLILR